MRQLFYLIILSIFFLGCDDNYENIHRYSKTISQSKQYPVYLDMSEIEKIQVKEKTSLVSPFKILANDKYYFVGDMLKGVHVYEKKTTGAVYLCFIDCKFLKDFEIMNNHLYCNNLVDLVVIDVSNPLQSTVLHRKKYHFNRFTKYVTYWNIPFEEDKGLIVGYQNHILTGTVTDEQPQLDFTEYDIKYGNLTTTEIPDSWVTDKPENDKPYVGVVKIGDDEIYTYGEYNSWAICKYDAGTINVREVDLWTKPAGKYSVPYYYSNAHPVRILHKENHLYVFGQSFYQNDGYVDCAPPDDEFRFKFHLYFSDFFPLDVTYFDKWDTFFVLSGQSIWGAYKSYVPTMTYTIERYKNYQVQCSAKAMFGEQDKIVTLGDELAVHLPDQDNLHLVKKYPIQGSCYLKEDNILTIVNAKGLFFYDISDLENIHLIP